MSATMSPSAQQPYGIKRVCTVWNISRATIQRHKARALYSSTAAKTRGPKTCLPDAQLLEEIKNALLTSPFVGEGYRKVWARLRQHSSVFSAAMRILRTCLIMREHNVLVPTRCRPSPGPRVHDRSRARNSLRRHRSLHRRMSRRTCSKAWHANENHRHDSQTSTNLMLYFEGLRIDTTITGSSGVLATRRPHRTDALSSWSPREESPWPTPPPQVSASPARSLARSA